MLGIFPVEILGQLPLSQLQVGVGQEDLDHAELTRGDLLGVDLLGAVGEVTDLHHVTVQTTVVEVLNTAHNVPQHSPPLRLFSVM